MPPIPEAFSAASSTSDGLRTTTRSLVSAADSTLTMFSGPPSPSMYSRAFWGASGSRSLGSTPLVS